VAGREPKQRSSSEASPFDLGFGKSKLVGVFSFLRIELFTELERDRLGRLIAAIG